jgi:uncharacterized protein YjbI with pentapeptide repeats
LSLAHFEQADLSGAKLRGADLSCANLQDANLCGTDLGGANLLGATLLGILLDARSNLRDVRIHAEQLRDVDLSALRMENRPFPVNLARSA